MKSVKSKKPKFKDPITVIDSQLTEMRELFSNMINEIVKIKNQISQMKVEISEIQKSILKNAKNEIENLNFSDPKMKNVKMNS